MNESRKTEREAALLRHLANALSKGDQQAWEELYRLLFDAVHKFTGRIVRSAEDAADISQEVFISLWENRDKVDPDKNIGGYLYAIARTLTYRFLRERARRSGHTSLSELPEPSLTDISPDDILAADELQILLDMVLETMPRQRREVFKMSRYEGLSYDEVAEKMGIARRTVESHIYHVTRELRALLCLALTVAAPAGFLLL